MRKPKPKKKPTPQYEYDFVKGFIDKGLYLSGINYTENEISGDKGTMNYLLTPAGHYCFYCVYEGKFEAWARNQGAYEAALKEGFKETQIMKDDIIMGLPIWIELADPESVVRFLTRRDFRIVAPTGKVFTWIATKGESEMGDSGGI